MNEGTLKGAITPSLHGDLKVDNNHFALLPVSVEDLANNDLQRNVFLSLIIRKFIQQVVKLHFNY